MNKTDITEALLSLTPDELDELDDFLRGYNQRKNRRMPAQVSKSQILSKLKNKSKGGWKEARKVEPKARGGGGLPPNIKNAVAVAKSCKLGLTEKGDPYFTFTGIIKEPEDLEGRRATLMWFLNESDWQTFEEAERVFANDLGLLLGEGEEIPEDYDDVLEKMKELCERGIHFLFNTGRPAKNGGNPRVYLQGLADGWEDDPQEGAGEEEAQPERSSSNSSPKKSSGAKTKPVEDEPSPTEDEAVEYEEATEEEETEEEAYVPQKGDQYNFKPKGAKASEAYEVTACNADKGTVDLKQVKVKKGAKALAFKGVPFDKLEVIEE